MTYNHSNSFHLIGRLSSGPIPQKKNVIGDNLYFESLKEELSNPQGKKKKSGSKCGQ